LAHLAGRESACLARRKPETNTFVSVFHRWRDKEIWSYYRRTPAWSRVEVKAEEVVAGDLAVGYCCLRETNHDSEDLGRRGSGSRRRQGRGGQRFRRGSGRRPEEWGAVAVD
jgi:hypothetical protein